MPKQKKTSKLRIIIVVIIIIFLLMFLLRLKKNKQQSQNSQDSTIISSNKEIPATYSNLYTTLDEELNAFTATLNTTNKTNVIKGAELLTANTHRGADLLDRKAMAGNILYLDHLQEIGVKGVSVSLMFPVLLNDYPQSEEYWQFYKDLVAEIRRRDLVLHMDIGSVFKEREYSSIQVNYDEVSKEDYIEGKKQIAIRVLKELQPDYLTLVGEPDTEAAILGFTTSADEYSRLVSQVAQEAGASSTLLGAGSGTWDSIEFVEIFAQNPDLDYVDLHIYPLSNGITSYLEQAVKMTNIAKVNGKKVIIGEMWLYKAAPKDLVRGEASTDIFQRDPFSFWSPLDQKMLQTVYDMAEANGIEYVSPFWSQYFFSYLEYDSHKNKPYLQLQSQVNKDAVQNMLEGKISETGAFYKGMK